MRRVTLATASLVLALVVALGAYHLGTSRSRSLGPADLTAGRVSTAPSSQPPVHPRETPAVLDSSSATTAWTVGATEFVHAFLDRSSSRTARLDAITTPRLAALLVRTDPGKIPSGRPVGHPQLLDDAGAVITVTQQLSDGSSFAFDLVSAPTRRNGWVVTSVRPGDH